MQRTFCVRMNALHETRRGSRPNRNENCPILSPSGHDAPARSLQTAVPFTGSPHARTPPSKIIPALGSQIYIGRAAPQLNCSRLLCPSSWYSSRSSSESSSSSGSIWRPQLRHPMSVIFAPEAQRL
eukprot:2813013-Rhodomonas_salina.2